FARAGKRRRGLGLSERIGFEASLGERCGATRALIAGALAIRAQLPGILHLVAVVTKLGHCDSAEIGKNSCTFLANEDPVAVFKGGFIHAGSFCGIDER